MSAVRTADPESELRATRAELEELRARYARRTSELEAQVRELREELGARLSA